MITPCLLECTERCPSTNLMYDDMGCKPIYAKEGDCCPIKYDCSHIENRPPNKCHFNGVFYDVDTVLDNSLTKNNCIFNCRCEESTEFRCAITGCPDFEGGQIKPECSFTYLPGECCSNGLVCDASGAKCQVGGEEYLEGNKFSPPDGSCKVCICQKGFRGIFEEPFCRKKTCSVEIKFSKEIHENCAPAYNDLTDCCPWEFICPEESDVIIKASTTPNNSGVDLQCKYGDKIFNIGDRMERTEEFNVAKCECKVPPLLTCQENY